ncbi:hypothetical protein QBC34DRAFT_437891 [Podospora aff. communis PSN243]|uniref:Uncharacterized protein n=1 Tax=Podospora aff. communis PSN243 TaxID=3040156 RepID=A0AAV9GPE8_9PEZI|nr:hypothetical protein QBC34DRAFT_437891 [Podospora aff. communis PSN243]
MAVMCLLGCAAASGIVVAVSHNGLVSSWSIQPTVLLAIFSAISNIAFSAALAAGVAVRFWLSVSQGVDLAQLHYIWDRGRVLSLIGAIRSGPEARKVALLASLAYMVQFSSGPLLQRSTYQDTSQVVTTEQMSLNIASRIPDGWFGNQTLGNGTGIGTPVGFQANGLPLIQDWFRSVPMTTNPDPDHAPENNPCSGTNTGTCNGYVLGAGFSYTCTSSQTTLDIANTTTNNATVFLVNVFSPSNTTLLLNTTHISSVSSSCLATLTTTTCTLAPATVHYPITLSNSTLILRTPFTSLLSTIPNNDTNLLPALAAFARTRLTDNATKTYLPSANRTSYRGPALAADLFFLPSPSPPLPARCAILWSPPTNYTLQALYEFSLRASLRAAATTTETLQTFEAQRTVAALVYRVEARFLGVGIGMVVLGAGMLGGLMFGWWRLERGPVTLSPVETAGEERVVARVPWRLRGRGVREILEGLEKGEEGGYYVGGSYHVENRGVVDVQHVRSVEKAG